MESIMYKKVELVLMLYHFITRVLVILCYCPVCLSKVSMKKKGYTNYWLSFILDFQTDVTNLMTERGRCMDKAKHSLFTQWNNL